MLRSIIYSILTIVAYFLVMKGFGEIFKYIVISNETMLDINEDYFYLADTIVYSILILLIFLIKKKINNVYNIKNVISFKSLLIIIALGFLFRLFEDPFIRVDIILGYKDFPVIEDFQLSGFLGKTISFINIVLLASIFEELIFRSLILSFFKTQNLYFGIFFSSLLFAIIHINNLASINYISIGLNLIFGVITCAVFLRYGLRYSIMLHIIYNLIWYILNEYNQEYWNVLKQLNFGILYWLICLVSSILVLLFIYQSSRTVKDRLNKKEIT